MSELEAAGAQSLWAVAGEAGSWGMGTVREPRGRGTSAVESRYQKTTGEDTAG
jgi:hypothetical protein